MRTQLEFQADRIETVLSLYKVPVRVTGGTVTPRWVRFTVLPAMGAKISHIKNLHEELAAALDTPTCHISRRGAAIAIEVPRDDPQPVHLLPLFHQLTNQPTNPLNLLTNRSPIPPVTAILGLAEDGSPLLIRLPSPDVGHILVAGNDGAGKTMLLQVIVLSLAMANSPNDLSFIFLGDGLPEMTRAVRQMGFSTHRIKGIGMAVIRAGIGTVGKRVIIIADDVTGNDDIAIAWLNRLMKGCTTRHYILGWLGIPPVKAASLFPVRLVGRVTSVKDARTATGWSGTGAERLLGRGDFLAVVEGKVNRFQAAYVTPAEIQEITNGNGRPRLHS